MGHREREKKKRESEREREREREKERGRERKRDRKRKRERAREKTMRTYGGNKTFRFVESICWHRKSCQIRFFFEKGPFHIIRAQHVLSYYLI